MPGDAEDQSLEQPPPLKTYRGDKKLFRILEDIVQPPSAIEGSPSEKANREVSRYVADEVVVDWDDCSPLERWVRLHHRYPLLAQLARKYFLRTSDLSALQKGF